MQVFMDMKLMLKITKLLKLTKILLTKLKSVITKLKFFVLLYNICSGEISPQTRCPENCIQGSRSKSEANIES